MIAQLFNNVSTAMFFFILRVHVQPTKLVLDRTDYATLGNMIQIIQIAGSYYSLKNLDH